MRVPPDRLLRCYNPYDTNNANNRNDRYNKNDDSSDNNVFIVAVTAEGRTLDENKLIFAVVF